MRRLTALALAALAVLGLAACNASKDINLPGSAAGACSFRMVIIPVPGVYIKGGTQSTCSILPTLYNQTVLVFWKRPGDSAFSEVPGGDTVSFRVPGPDPAAVLEVVAFIPCRPAKVMVRVHLNAAWAPGRDITPVSKNYQFTHGVTKDDCTRK